MKKVYGVGVNDADYVTQPKGAAACPYYVKWKDMLRRCYSEKFHNKQPSYRGCTVCEEWKYFSNFKKWMETQDWEGLELDKDILFIGNKSYSGNSCSFVPKYINSMLVDSLANRGKNLLGVSYYPGNRPTLPYTSSIKIGINKMKRKRFASELDAHNFWQKEKAKTIKHHLDSYRKERGYRQDVEEALLNRVLLLEICSENKLVLTSI